ncbi:MAG: hypothetical protein ACREOD_01555 [Candidatus Dormibacteria bacterium]
MATSSLQVPEHSELPAEVRQAFVELDRKCGVFIFPQLRQLQAEEAIEGLRTESQRLASEAAEGRHQGLEDAYRQLLDRAQAALRQARAQEVAQAGPKGQQERHQVQVASSLAAARTRLPPARLARLEEHLRQLGENSAEPGPAQQAAVEAALSEFERLLQDRQTREAERLRHRAHLPVRPRQQHSSRSRRARRDQALVVELARSFNPELGPSGEPAPPPDADQ